MESSEGVWPESVIFWGAGATAKLGQSGTNEIGLAIHKWFSQEDAFEGNFPEKEFPRLLDPIKDDFKKWYNALISEKGQKEFDFMALKIVVSLVPLQENEGALFLNDLYNVIDGNIQSHRGVLYWDKNSKEEKILPFERIVAAKRLLDLLQSLMLMVPYQNLLDKGPEKLKPYVELVESLGQLMQEEGVCLSSMLGKDNKIFSKRAFYLFSYAVISMNYEPVFLWLLLNAHKKLNEGSAPYLGNPGRKLKLFNDFSLFMGIRRIGKEDRENEEVWYPSNEPVAQRLNSYNELGSVQRVGKFYYPHGCLNFRECPNCGKLNVKMGTEWGYEEKSLAMPPPFESRLFVSDKWLSSEEKCGSGETRCSFCGTKMNDENMMIVPQSSFKGLPPSFIEEIQRDMKVCLHHARHVVLLGYSLPKDDATWRSVLMARKSKDCYCSVVVGYKGEKRWLEGDALTKFIDENKGKDSPESYGIPTIITARSIFGDENVRAWTGGIPDVWLGGKEAAREMLYPSKVFVGGFPWALSNFRKG